MKFHEAANIFPLLSDEQLDALADDIQAHGLRDRIETLDGQILDGRNRYRACLLRQIKPTTVAVTTDDPVAYVLSKNLHRRHLTPSQISMVGARARKFYDEEATKRLKTRGGHSGPVNFPEAVGDARDQVGKAVGVSGRTIDFATKVLEEGTPELIRAVDEGRMAVSTAAVFASEPPEKQKAALAGQHNRTYPRAPAVVKGTDGRPPIRGLLSKAMEIATFVISHLERIRDDDPKRHAAFNRVKQWIEQKERTKR